MSCNMLESPDPTHKECDLQNVVIRVCFLMLLGLAAWGRAFVVPFDSALASVPLQATAATSKWQRVVTEQDKPVTV
jgi:hypothetical protein